MVELLKAHPEGLTSGELREKLNLAANKQAQLDRRRRDLKIFFIIEKTLRLGSGLETQLI